MLKLRLAVQTPPMLFDNGHAFEFNSAFEKLGNRAKHILERIGANNIQEFYDSVIPNYYPDYFIDLRNCGIAANQELCHFKSKVDDIIDNHYLYKSNGLFDDINRVINNGFLKDVEYDIFENHFLFNVSKKTWLTLDQIATRNGLTRERIRQYKVSLLPKLESLIVNLWQTNTTSPYVQEEFFSVNEKLVRIINERESVCYSSNFITYVFSCIVEPIYEFHPIDIKPPNFHGLFTSPISGFNWKALLNDVSQLMNSKRTENIEFLLINFISGYFQKSAMYNSEIHKKRIVDNLIFYSELVNTQKNKFLVTEDSLTFIRTTKKKVYEYIVDLLNEQKQPMHFVEIYDEFKRRGIKATSPTAIQGAMMGQPEVFGLKGQGIYGLLEWGGYFGTIGDVAEQLLRERNGPIPWIELRDFLARELVISEDSINTVLFFYEGESRFVHKGPKVHLAEWENTN